jgi:hypothetical protein
VTLGNIHIKNHQEISGHFWQNCPKNKRFAIINAIQTTRGIQKITNKKVNENMEILSRWEEDKYELSKDSEFQEKSVSQIMLP